MGLRKQKGNMYGFVSHTWNAIKGECTHFCSYCYMHGLWRSKIKLDEYEFNIDLGKNNFIFVGSSTDMFADNIPKEWIIKVLDYCRKYNNRYLFQTKNTKRFLEFINNFPDNSILATTIESNREYNISKAPNIQERINHMKNLSSEKMITIEPIMDFDLTELINLIKQTNPSWVIIGAGSKNHNLPEPSKEKIQLLISELGKFTKVHLKDNLSRIYKGVQNGI